ncbi:PREDICTED: cyclin-dependent kinase G-2-like isoform X2 [Lupinus angustifolius]|uniref:cyclin-dependent kinase G-2-like isoform X2 n=1 Tax=Lupinus angustifolius TaxID=3871 RepID=UPI00092F38E6|nr:PREDICTED: cyclin-dependent kinase G-2-like isoform X2 [Lupinus angustifolius]
MAAGRKSVVRKSDSLVNGSFKEHRNDSYGMKVDESYNFHATRSAKQVFHVGKEEREEGELCFEHGEADMGEVLPPPEKKKKISPIVWDLAEENGVEDVDEDEENKVKGWNITMSRWASDGLSPMSTDDKSKGLKVISSVETDEFQRELSESTITRSSGSCGRDNCLGRSTSDSVSDKEFCSDSIYGNGEQSDVSDSPDSDEDSGLVDVRTDRNMFQSCRSICEFEMIKKINEGTYGVVYKARDKKTGEIVAIKKVKMNISRDGFPVSALREMNILLSFNHPSIIDVKEVAVDDYDGTFMVMEYMEHDLKELMKEKKQPFSIGEIKSMMKQLLEGVKYIHDNWVIHRDLKTSNILLDNEGHLKICDFGLSRQYGSPLKPYTPVVVTLWYRAPELLLGAKEYSTAIDMWSVGCIMAELISKEALFAGKSEVEQLDKIVRTLGTPDEKIWPGLSKLPGSKGKFVKQPYSILRRKFRASSFIGLPVLSELGFDLLEKLLTYDPEKRITAEDALLHDWFHEAPLPKSDFNPILPSWRG